MGTITKHESSQYLPRICCVVWFCYWKLLAWKNCTVSSLDHLFSSIHFCPRKYTVLCAFLWVFMCSFSLREIWWNVLYLAEQCYSRNVNMYLRIWENLTNKQYLALLPATMDQWCFADLQLNWLSISSNQSDIFGREKKC